MATVEVDDELIHVLADHVLPLLPPFEFSVYFLLLRLGQDNGKGRTVRVGVRTLAEALGTSTQGQQTSYNHIQKKLTRLCSEGFLSKGDTTRSGTLYHVHLPAEVPAVRESMASPVPTEAADYFTDPALRISLFERDGWRCRYCGEILTESSATLDHITPRWKGGSNDPENLATTCLMCNSIKSGRTYEEAAPDLLRRVAEQRSADTPDTTVVVSRPVAIQAEDEIL